MINVYCFYCNNSTLATDDPDTGAFRNIYGLVCNGLPDVAIDLDASEATSLDSLHHPALPAHQRIGITDTIVLAFVQIALGKGTYPEEADECKHSEDHQLQIDP